MPRLALMPYLGLWGVLTAGQVAAPFLLGGGSGNAPE